MIISSGERPKKGQFIEFAIYTDDKHEEICGGDLNHMNGSQWREVNKLVAECEAGLHPNVSLIERVINYTEGDWDVVDKEEEELYRNPLFIGPNGELLNEIPARSGGEK